MGEIKQCPKCEHWYSEGEPCLTCKRRTLRDVAIDSAHRRGRNYDDVDDELYLFADRRPYGVRLSEAEGLEDQVAEEVTTVQERIRKIEGPCRRRNNRNGLGWTR